MSAQLLLYVVYNIQSKRAHKSLFALIVVCDEDFMGKLELSFNNNLNITPEQSGTQRKANYGVCWLNTEE